jgi:ABC-type Mn2+/Zn2+ transport system ATPase subunit
MFSHRLEIRDLTISYKRLPAVHHLSLELLCGSCIGLLGPNGAGKTSLLKAIVGLVPIESGSIRFHGREHPRTLSDIAYLPQRSAIDWDFPITVREMVEMGRYPSLGWWRSFRPTDRREVNRALEVMDLVEVAERQISALSGGQQQRAFLARSLAQKAHVFLLDEPFAGLDKPTQEHLGETIRKLAQAGNLVIASHHDLKNVRDLFDHVIFLNGELVAFGETADVLNDDNIRRTFQTHIFSGVTHEPGIAL